MRLIFIIIISLTMVSSANAQFMGSGTMMSPHVQEFAASANKKWTLSGFTGIQATTFWGGGQWAGTGVSPVLGIQLNRRLTNNWYAFANASIAPVGFNSMFGGAMHGFNTANPYTMQPWLLGKRVGGGLTYINDERTFSISGSIHVQQNNFSGFRPPVQEYPVHRYQ